MIPYPSVRRDAVEVVPEGSVAEHKLPCRHSPSLLPGVFHKPTVVSRSFPTRQAISYFASEVTSNEGIHGQIPMPVTVSSLVLFWHNNGNQCAIHSTNAVLEKRHAPPVCCNGRVYRSGKASDHVDVQGLHTSTHTTEDAACRLTTVLKTVLSLAHAETLAEHAQEDCSLFDGADESPIPDCIATVGLPACRIDACPSPDFHACGPRHRFHQPTR